MAELTRVVTIVITIIDDEKQFTRTAEQTEEYLKDRYCYADDVQVKVQDFYSIKRQIDREEQQKSDAEFRQLQLIERRNQ